MTVDDFLKKLNETPEKLEFSELMNVIDAEYEFSETAFTNGELLNKAGENSGSCKLFAFGKLNELTKQQTLDCFGAYYREDVLQNPDLDNHQNIRNYMKTGWAGIQFDGNALS